MAYASIRLGHIAANQWEFWNISSTTGKLHTGAIIQGRTSGATAIVMAVGINFSFALASVNIVRYNGTAFTGSETCDVYTVNGGASVGTFVLAAAASSTAIHPIVVVTGTDTVNLFEYVYSASVAGGWGYHSTNNTSGQLDCTIMVGNPFQVAVTSAVSKNEAVIHNGGLWCLGNSTYATTFTIGEGTQGDVGSTKNGSTIDNDLTIAPVIWWGSGRYGKMNIFSSFINSITGGWAMDLTNVTTTEVQNLGSLEFITFPVAGYGYDASDIIKLKNVVAGGGFLLAHGQLEFDDVYIGGNGSYGIVFFGPGDLTATNLQVLNSVGIADVFAFIGSGAKTFIDCDLDEQDVTGFWSSYTTAHQYSVNATCLTPSGDAVEDVRIRGWDGSQSLPGDAGTPDFNVQSNASGVITTQYCTYATAGSPASYVNLNPWNFFVDIAGMKEKLFEQTLAEATTFELTMENVESDF